MAPDDAWVTDITHIRTHEGWLHLAVVVGLRKVYTAVITALGIKRPIPKPFGGIAPLPERPIRLPAKNQWSFIRCSASS